MRHPFRQRLGLILALLFVLSGAMMPGAALGQTTTPTPTKGYYYVVKSGDNWTRISQTTGIPIEALKENNPKAAGHPRGWLIVGEQLFIPGAAATPAGSPTVPAAPGDQKGVWYQVRRGDTWAALSSATGVSIERLWAANAGRLDANRGLYAEQWILIPTGDTVAPAASVTPAAVATVTPTTVATTIPPTADASPTATATPAAAIVALDQIAAAAATVSAAVQAAATVSSAAESAATVVAAVHTISTAAAAAQAAATSIAALNLNAIPVPAVVAVSTATLTPVPTVVAVSTTTPTSIPTVAAVSTATLTPIPTVAAVSTATPTPVPATAAPTRPAAAAATSTPTRRPTVAANTPTATSAPTRAAGASNCLSDKVIAANAVFDRWNQDGFPPAMQAYQAVLADTTSTACGKVTGELDLLRDFARYRLLIASIAGGQARQVQTLTGQIKNAALKSTAEAFQASLKSSGSIVQACRDANSFAQSKPEVWRSLAELGIRLKPAEICPLG